MAVVTSGYSKIHASSGLGPSAEQTAPESTMHAGLGVDASDCSWCQKVWVTTVNMTWLSCFDSRTEGLCCLCLVLTIWLNWKLLTLTVTIAVLSYVNSLGCAGHCIYLYMELFLCGFCFGKWGKTLWLACLRYFRYLDDTEAEDHQYCCLHLSYKYWYWTKLVFSCPHSSLSDGRSPLSHHEKKLPPTLGTRGIIWLFVKPFMWRR